MATRLLLLPGVGADHRLFDAQRTCATRIDVIPWIAPATPDESLRDCASRLAATVDTNVTRPVVVNQFIDSVCDGFQPV